MLKVTAEALEVVMERSAMAKSAPPFSTPIITSLIIPFQLPCSSWLPYCRETRVDPDFHRCLYGRSGRIRFVSEVLQIVTLLEAIVTKNRQKVTCPSSTSLNEMLNCRNFAISVIRSIAKPSNLSLPSSLIGCEGCQEELSYRNLISTIMQ